MMHVMQTRPALLDRATLGNPGKYACYYAENKASQPWELLHAECGFRPWQSTVTVYDSNSLSQVYHQLTAAPEPLLLCLIAALGNTNTQGFQPDADNVIGCKHSQHWRDWLTSLSLSNSYGFILTDNLWHVLFVSEHTFLKHILYHSKLSILLSEALLQMHHRRINANILIHKIL